MKTQNILLGILFLLCSYGANAQKEFTNVLRPKVQAFFSNDDVSWSSSDYTSDPFLDNEDALIFNFNVAHGLIISGGITKGDDLGNFAQNMFKNNPKMEYVELIAKRPDSTQAIFYIHKDENRRAITIKVNPATGKEIVFIQDKDFLQIKLKMDNAHGVNDEWFYSKSGGELIVSETGYAIKGTVPEWIVNEKTTNKTQKTYEELKKFFLLFLEKLY